MPTAPWMKAPRLLQPREVLNPSKPTTKKGSNRNAKAPDKALFGKESGVRGKKVMKNIIRSMEKLQGNVVLEVTQIGISEEFELEKWLEEIGRDGEAKKYDTKMPWFMFRKMKKEKVLTQAEISLDKDLLERLRRKAIRMRKWVTVMKAVVTQAVVDKIRLAWRKNELVMVKFGVPLCRNMDRARGIVEVLLLLQQLHKFPRVMICRLHLVHLLLAHRPLLFYLVHTPRRNEAGHRPLLFHLVHTLRRNEAGHHTILPAEAPIRL